MIEEVNIVSFMYDRKKSLELFGAGAPAKVEARSFAVPVSERIVVVMVKNLALKANLIEEQPFFRLLDEP